MRYRGLVGSPKAITGLLTASCPYLGIAFRKVVEFFFKVQICRTGASRRNQFDVRGYRDKTFASLGIQGLASG
jgi:hypothetical protein